MSGQERLTRGGEAVETDAGKLRLRVWNAIGKAFCDQQEAAERDGNEPWWGWSTDDITRLAADAAITVVRPVAGSPVHEDEPKTGPHDLVISAGDCEFYGSCSCGKALGDRIRPDESLNVLGERWERHVMAAHRDCTCEQCSW